MARIRGMEQALVNVQTFLQTNMPAVLSAVSSDWGDDVALPDVAKYEHYVGMLPSLYDELPAVYLVGSGSVIANDRGGKFILNHGITAAVVVEDATESVLSTKILRYLQALLETLCLDRQQQTMGRLFWGLPAGSGAAEGGSLLPINYSPQVSQIDESGSHWYQAAAIEFTIGRDEVQTINGY